MRHGLLRRQHAAVLLLRQLSDKSTSGMNLHVRYPASSATLLRGGSPCMVSLQTIPRNGRRVGFAAAVATAATCGSIMLASGVGGQQRPTVAAEASSVDVPPGMRCPQTARVAPSLIVARC